jgi:hypothetical protein
MSGEPPVPMILAQQVLTLFEESGATPKEQQLALDIVRPLVIDKVYGPTFPEGQKEPQEFP